MLSGPVAMFNRMNEPVQLAERRGREGNRWVNQRPSADEVGEWFKSVPLHDGMDHKDWVAGITLIQATETADEVVGFATDGRPQVVPDVKHTFYVPYPKVETRTAYFNALMQSTDAWTGFVLPVAAPDSKGMSVGFFPVRVALPDGTAASMICNSHRCIVIEGEVEWQEIVDADGVTRRYPTGNVVIDATGTKAVPLLDRWAKLDVNALMKAETGAKGRALGFAGMLVIPGSGVATAEDVQESQQGGGTGSGAPAPADEAPAAPIGPDELRNEVGRLYGILSAHPDELRTFQAWAKERKLGKLTEVEGAALKGLVMKLQKTVAALPKEEEAAAPLDLGGEPETPVEPPPDEAL